MFTFKRLLKLYILIIGSFVVSISQAQVSLSTADTVTLSSSLEGRAAIVENQLRKLVGDVAIKSISETEIENVYLFEDIRGSMAYVYVQGNYVLLGDAYDVENRRELLTEARDKKLVDAVASVADKDFIELGPDSATRYIDVFTDIDCGYCRKLHFETLPELAKHGVKARYLMWPRTGAQGESYDKAVTAYCSADQRDALNELKSGKTLANIQCENPVAELVDLGRKNGIRGTPTIITDNGQVINGYLPAEKVLAIMGM